MDARCPIDADEAERKVRRLCRELRDAGTRAEAVRSGYAALPDALKDKAAFDRARGDYVRAAAEYAAAKDRLRRALSEHGEPVDLDYAEWLIDFQTGGVTTRPMTC